MTRFAKIAPVLPLLIVAACSAGAAWPLPVPERRIAGGVTPRRLELAIPLPAPYDEATRADYERAPEHYPKWRDILEFMEHHAPLSLELGKRAPVLDSELWSLLAILADTSALGGIDFPSDADSLPVSIRNYKTPAVVDSRDETPGAVRPPVAVLYRGFWWTFWLKRIDDLPDPDETTAENLRRKPCFDTLIVFPEYRSR